MALRNFFELSESVTSVGRRPVAVVAAADAHAVEALLAARKSGLAEPLLVGDAKKIEALLRELGEGARGIKIVNEPNDDAACRRAVALIKSGEGHFLMKGKTDTATLLKAVVDRESGLRTGGVMSHLAIFEVPGYHKLLTVADGGMIPYPTLAEKRSVIENTVAALSVLGYALPKVGVLACVEKVNPEMPETVEAAKLAQMNVRGEIAGCIVEGPVSYDCAVSREIAGLKGYGGAIAGDADVLIAPNIHAGNIMGKMLLVTCGAKMAGIVVGAACPIVLTSRAASAEEKFLSVMLSAALVRRQGACKF